MDYRYSNRLLRSGEIADRRDFDKDFIPAGEKLSGLIGPHNVAEDAVTSVADDFFYTPYPIIREADPGWANGTLPTFPVTAPNAFKVKRTMAWQTVTDMVSTIESSKGFVWVNAWCTYLWGDWDSNVAGAFVPANIQMAIRIDGEVIPMTIPGVSSTWGRPPRPVRADGGTKKKAASVKGPIRMDSAPMLGIGPGAATIRCSCVVPVGPGSHTIEMVARVLPSPFPNLFGTEDVYIFNRCMLTLDVHQAPREGSGAMQVLDIEPFEKGATITRVAMEARRDRIKNNINDLEPGHFRRGSIGNMHYTPTAARDAEQKAVDANGQVTYQKVYPGFTSDTFSTTPAGVANAWTVLQDTGGTSFCRTNGPHPSNWPTGKSIYLILANIRLHEKALNVAFSNGASYNAITAAAIFKRESGGSEEIIDSSIGFLNGFAGIGNDGTGNTKIAEEYDIPLMAIVEAPAGHSPYDDFGAVVASFDPTGATAPYSICGHSSVQVIQLRVT